MFDISQAILSMHHAVHDMQKARYEQHIAEESERARRAKFDEMQRKHYGRDAIDVEARFVEDTPLLTQTI